MLQICEEGVSKIGDYRIVLDVRENIIPLLAQATPIRRSAGRDDGFG